MVLYRAHLIPSMVSQIKDDQVKLLTQERPERIVEINRQTIAVTQDKLWPCNVAVPTQYNCRISIHPYIIHRMWLRNLPYGFR